MWTLTDGTTNVATVPTEGLISVVKPHGVKVSAFVNGNDMPLHHLHVKAGDTVSFKVRNKLPADAVVMFDYAGNVSKITVPGAPIKEDKMDTSNLFAVPTMGSGGMGGAIGGGLGAGLLGGILGGVLLNNGGILGNKSSNPASVESVESIVNNSSIQQALGDIKAAIPYNEAQMQLALAGAQADINNNINNGTSSVLNTINTQSITNANYIAGVNANISQTAAMNLAATKDSSAANLAATNAVALGVERGNWALTQVVTNDGDKTRALIQSIDKTNDSRMITDLANQVAELRNESRLTAATGNITISNNNAATANQAQQQAQQQQQQIAYLSNQLATLVAQNQHIQQGVLNIGSGTVAGTSQTAANTRVN